MPKNRFFGLREPLPRSVSVPLGFVMPVLVLGAWCIASYGRLAPPDFLPSPTEVIRGTLQLFIEHDLGLAIWISTKRILIAFGLAAGVALPLGVLMGAFEPVNRLFEPIMAPLRYMPISAFIPLLILWFGIYESQKIAFLFLGVFVYLLPVVVTAIRAVPDELVQTALTLGRVALPGGAHDSGAGLPAGDLRLVPRDERHLVDVRHPGRSGESRTRPGLHGRTGAHAPEGLLVVCRPAGHRRHRPD